MKYHNFEIGPSLKSNPFDYLKMSTARIDLHGQGYTTSYTANGDVTIDRAFPGLLDGFMSQFEWTTFCDRIDEALRPVSALKKKMRMYYCLYVLLFVGMSAAIPILATSDIAYNLVSSAAYVPILVVIFCVPMGLFYFLARRMTMKAKEILAGVQKVCDEESAKRSNVSFHIRVSFSIKHIVSHINILFSLYLILHLL